MTGYHRYNTEARHPHFIIMADKQTGRLTNGLANHEIMTTAIDMSINV